MTSIDLASMFGAAMVVVLKRSIPVFPEWAGAGYINLALSNAVELACASAASERDYTTLPCLRDVHQDRHTEHYVYG